MNQSHLLIDQLKKVLKAQGYNYQTLAQKLKISESSVKRSFSQRRFTIERLGEICDLLGIEFYDLAKSISTLGSGLQKTLSLEQEKVLAQNPKLFAYFYLLTAGNKPNDIIRKFQFSETESTAFLLQLDRLGMLKFHSSKKVQLLFSRNVQWLPEGPLRKLYGPIIAEEFMQSQFLKANEGVHFFSGYFSEQEFKNLQRKIKKLVLEIQEISELNTEQLQSEKIWLLFAYRPWLFSQVYKWKK